MTNKIKIILAGAWLHPMYEEASCYALQNLGAEVIPYNWGHLYKRPLFRFEVKYSIKGPSLYKLNKCKEEVHNDIVKLDKYQT